MGRNERLALIEAKINKDYGNKIIESAQCVVDSPRLSTGSLSFDRGLGGGIPAGYAVLFHGGASSGKTTTAYRIAGLAQKLCANCLRPVEKIDYEWIGETEVTKAYCDCYKKGIFKPIQNQDEKPEDFKRRISQYEENSYQQFKAMLVDMEGAFDRAWAQKLGLRPGALMYTRPNSAEEAIDIYVDMILSAAVDLIIIDSLAAMTPAEEIEKGAAEATQGLLARKLGLWNRKVSVAMNSIRNDYRHFPTQIWINQEREKIGGTGWGDNSVCPGGKSQLFSASTIIKMWTEKCELETLDDDLPEEHRAKVGSTIKMGIKIEKCRVAPPRYQATYPMIISGDRAGQIDDTKYFLAMCEKFGLVRTEGEGAKKKWWVGDQEYSKKGDAMSKVMEPQTNAIMRRIVMDNLLGIKDGDVTDNG
jgi:recombination protein RecA